MQVFEKTVVSKYMPHDNNVVWIDISKDTPVVNIFVNGQWKNASSGDFPVETEMKNELKPDTIYNLGSISSNITIPNISEDGEGYKLYTMMFNVGDNVYDITFPLNWIWQDGEQPEIEANMHYEISVYNADNLYASYMKFPLEQLES